MTLATSSPSEPARRRRRPVPLTTPLVLTLDIGSTATRGGVHDASGRRVHGLQHKVEHAFTVAPDGTSVIDPDQVMAEVEQVLDAVTGDPRLGPTRLHISYHAPRLRWFAATDPRVVAGAAAWWSLGEYVLTRLIGLPPAGTSTV